MKARVKSTNEVVAHINRALVDWLVAEHPQYDVALDAALVRHIVLVRVSVSCASVTRLA